MRNFQKIAGGIDVLPLAHALQRQPELWNENRFRTSFERTPHAEVDDILLRYSEVDVSSDIAKVIDDTNYIWYPATRYLPQIKPIVLDLMRRVEAYELCRCLISRLAPGKRILPHTDVGGAYVHMTDVARYHIVVQGLPGSLYRTGDETICMQTGEVWWFNAHIEHEVVNNSKDDRIHLMVDVRTMQI